MYDELDKRIINAINARKRPLYDSDVCLEAARIAAGTGREEFRVIDGRMKALCKAGRISHLTQAESSGQGGWRVTITPALAGKGVD